MKIAHLADSHFQKKRLDECVECFGYIIGYLTANPPDYIFHAGDLFEKNVLVNSIEYRQAVFMMQALADIAPVFIVRGNHDPVNALKVFEKLNTTHPITLFEEIDAYRFFGEKFSLLAIPYQIPSLIGSGDSVSDIHKTGSDLIRNEIKSFIDATKDDNVPRLILAHISVMDAQFANSERIQEGEIIMPVEDFDRKEIDGVFLGHIHRNQQDIFKGKKIAYAGSHYRTRYDEMLEPGFCMWEFKDGEVDIKFLPTPARDMVQINLSEEDTKRLLAGDAFDFPKDSDVKVVLQVPQGMTKIVNSENILKMAPEGTVLDVAIKVNPIIEVRSEAMSSGLTDREKFDEWARVSEVDLTPTIKQKMDEIINHDQGVHV